MGYSTNFGFLPMWVFISCGEHCFVLEKYYIARNSHLQILPISVGLTIPVERQNGLEEENSRQFKPMTASVLHHTFIDADF